MAPRGTRTENATKERHIGVLFTHKSNQPTNQDELNASHFKKAPSIEENES